jgi:hypothetical protein
MRNLLSFILPYLELMLLAQRLKISLQQHLPDSEHHEPRNAGTHGLIIVTR